MNIETGKTYESLDSALADGVAREDIAEVRLRDGKPVVRFSKGSFKSFTRDKETGDLVRKG